MSFSLECKQELCRIIPNRRCCKIAELSALVKTTGIMQINGREIILKLNIESAPIARKVFILLKKLYNISVELMVRKNYYFNKHNTYTLIITEDMKLRDILIETKILCNENDEYRLNYGIDKCLIKDKCCKKAYLRGAFLGSASISNPEKTYHLEFVINNYDFAEGLKNLINSYDLNAKIIQRKGYYIVYLKEGEHIIDLLNIMGAHSSLLELENIRIYKEIRNNINRMVNCETSNLKKTADASIRQINNIKLIDDKIGISKLPDGLREIAELRLKYTEATLKELGEMLNPPISKSGVNHRLRKLDKIAERLKECGRIND